MSDAGVLLKRPPRWLKLSLFWTGRIVQTEGGEEEKQRTTAKRTEGHVGGNIHSVTVTLLHPATRAEPYNTFSYRYIIRQAGSSQPRVPSTDLRSLGDSDIS